MEISILSLNVHIWIKDLNPFNWKKFFIPRTVKMGKLFKRENPDVICLQERIYPLGRFALGLWKYKAFGSAKCRLPIYVKKSLLKQFIYSNNVEIMGTVDDNGHGLNILNLRNVSSIVRIQNCHHSWDSEKFKEEMSCGYYTNTIFCGDMNNNKYRVLSTYASLGFEEPIKVYDKTPEVNTYIGFDNTKTPADIDHFGYVGDDAPAAEVKVLPDVLSDHLPVIAKIAI